MSVVYSVDYPDRSTVRDGVSMDKAAILAAFTDKIARYKHPKDVIFVDRLPRNAMGKVLAGEVRKLVDDVVD